MMILSNEKDFLYTNDFHLVPEKVSEFKTSTGVPINESYKLSIPVESTCPIGKA